MAIPLVNIIKKYIIKEILLYFFVIIALFFFIFTTNSLVGLLTKVASGKLPLKLAMQAIVWHMPEALGILIPVSLFIAILFGISKLYADNEITPLFITGLNIKFLLKIIIVLAVIIAAINAYFTLYLIPYTTKIKEEILAKGEKGLLNSITPGYFQIINEGKLVFYVGDKNNENIEDIFIANNLEHKQEPVIVTAKSGTIKTTEEQDNFLVLQDGHRYAGSIDSSNFSSIDFVEYGKQLLFASKGLMVNKNKLRNIKEIWNSDNLEENAEWQWRLAMPISVIILAILALSLAKVLPRQGRFAKFLPAILLYIVYCNLMIFTRRLLVTGMIGSNLGIWVVHGVFLLLAILLLLKSSGWMLYIYKKL